jgi:hypothetical protein
VTYHPSRGHGLGMANALTTLMQIIIEDMVTEETEIYPEWSGYLNDDAAIVIKSSGRCYEFAAADARVCRALSLKYKDKGSFISPQSIVLCEVYASKVHGAISFKQEFPYETVAQLLRAYNPAHARYLAQSMNLSDPDESFIDKVLNYWGWVLHRGEQRDPTIIGGWWRYIKEGVDLSFIGTTVTTRLDNSRAAAFFANREVKLQFQPWKKGKKKRRIADRLNRMLATWIGVDKPTPIADYFRMEMNSQESRRAWDKYYDKLRLAFRRYESKRIEITWGEVYKIICHEKPETDIYPPVGAYELPEPRVLLLNDDVNVTSPFEPTFLTIEEKMADMGYSSEYCFRVPHFRTRLKGEKDRTMEWKLHRKHSPLTYKVWNVVPTPETIEGWHNPFNVLHVADTLDASNYRMPKILPEYKSSTKEKLLDLRLKVYGKEITPEEWILLGSVPAYDRTVARKLSKFWIEDPEFLEDLIVLLRLYPRVGIALWDESGYTGPAIIDSFGWYAVKHEKIKLEAERRRRIFKILSSEWEQGEPITGENCFTSEMEVNRDDLVVLDSMGYDVDDPQNVIEITPETGVSFDVENAEAFDDDYIDSPRRFESEYQF